MKSQSMIEAGKSWPSDVKSVPPTSEVNSKIRTRYKKMWAKAVNSLAVEQQRVYDVETHAHALDALVQLCAWLRAPTRSVTLVRIHAEALLPDWLQGGLVRDSLKVLASIEARDNNQLRATQPEPEAESAAPA